MIHKMFSVFDSGAAAYLPPFILPRDEMAVRTFADCCKAPDHQFGKFPQDYTLFRLGTFDDETAEFVREPNGPHPLGNGVIFAGDSEEQYHGTQPHESEQPLADEPSIQSGPAGSNSA